MKKKLGLKGPELSALGLGCMGMSGVYKASDDAHSDEVLNHTLDFGVEMIDTADIYGAGHNEILIGNAIGNRYGEAFIANKFGILLNNEGWPIGVSGKPEYVKTACERSLRRLKTDCIDLYYLHRADPETPIEDTVEALAQLVREGKIKHIGLSEASPNTIYRAAKVHQITAVQSEYSIFTRDVENEILPACHEVGAAFVAYSPLGRGMLTGTLIAVDENDVRNYVSERFSGENLEKNLTLVNRIKTVADRRGATPAQVALAWVLAQGDNVFAIFGTTRLENLQTNLKAMEVQLSPEELAELSSLSAEVQGSRHTEQIENACLVETPEQQ